jgi:hypothetical protein
MDSLRALTGAEIQEPGMASVEHPGGLDSLRGLTAPAIRAGMTLLLKPLYSPVTG